MFSYKKAKNVLALTAALSVLCSQSVFAATLELDLEETIQRALLTNPSVKIAEYNRKAAKADYTAKTGKKTVTSVELYIKPEDNRAYYVIDKATGFITL